VGGGFYDDQSQNGWKIWKPSPVPQQAGPAWDPPSAVVPQHDLHHPPTTGGPATAGGTRPTIEGLSPDLPRTDSSLSAHWEGFLLRRYAGAPRGLPRMQGPLINPLLCLLIYISPGLLYFLLVPPPSIVLLQRPL